MSTKARASRKSANPRAKAPEPIITRTKSAQQKRQLRNKEDKKTEKPELTKPEIKSPKSIKTVKRPQQSLLKKPIQTDDVVLVEQGEYYPNTLKRDVLAKKIMLKPKHNFKVIAATNKRKLATPQKGIKPQSSKNSSPKRSRASTKHCGGDLSMQDMVRIMEETRTLTDEDFMEILTCPSPVWWEDPPDGRFDEDLIHRKSPDRSRQNTTKDPKKKKIATSTSSSSSSKPKNNDIVTIELDSEPPKVTEKKKDEKFVKKQQKLENILGNIKNKTEKTNNEAKIPSTKVNRQISESEGDFSDMSFNEEEILKNLENMDIPVEETLEATKDSIRKKKQVNKMAVVEETIESEIAPKNDNVDRDLLIEPKPENKNEITVKSPVFDKDSSSELKKNVSLVEINSNSDKKSDDIVVLDSFSNSSISNSDDKASMVDIDNNTSESGTGKRNHDEISSSDANDSKNSEIIPDKKAKVSNENKNLKKVVVRVPNMTKARKLEIVRGKLNELLRQCDSNMRWENMDNEITAFPRTAVKEPTDNIKENGDDKNRLSSCDYCIEKFKNGMKDISCEKCEKAAILPCGLCNNHADTKEVLKKHGSSCKDIARISWCQNYVLNQT